MVITVNARVQSISGGRMYRIQFIPDDGVVSPKGRLLNSDFSECHREFSKKEDRYEYTGFFRLYIPDSEGRRVVGTIMKDPFKWHDILVMIEPCDFGGSIIMRSPRFISDMYDDDLVAEYCKRDLDICKEMHEEYLQKRHVAEHGYFDTDTIRQRLNSMYGIHSLRVNDDLDMNEVKRQVLYNNNEGEDIMKTNDVAERINQLLKEAENARREAKRAMVRQYQERISYFSVKDVIFNGPATIILWSDGTKTVVKLQNGETYDKEKAIAMAVSKRALGDKGYSVLFGVVERCEKELDKLHKELDKVQAQYDQMSENSKKRKHRAAVRLEEKIKELKRNIEHYEKMKEKFS